MILLPAVDVASGRATQVAAGSPDDPLQVARRWVDQGAQMLHVVDLDAAYRRGDNADLLHRLVTSLEVPVQLSGGIDTQMSAAAALATGARRINLASSALRNLALVRSLLREYGPRIVVGIDIRRGEVGTSEDSSDHEDYVIARGSDVTIGRVHDVVGSLVGLGASTVLVADASRDGSRRGVDLDMFARVTDLIKSQLGDVDVVASGGVATLADLQALRRLAPSGVTGVVLGAALHHGAFTLPQARAVVEASSMT